MYRLNRLGACLALGVLAASATAGSTLARLGGATSISERPSSPPSPAFDPARQRGHDFAVKRCSGCHTVGLDDGGASEGPAFRTLAKRYSASGLEQRFAEVSAHGFDGMPPVTITRREAEDLIAYFNTLRGD